MKAVVQRVSESSVSVENEIIGKIGRGLMILLGITHHDTREDAAFLADKIVHLRIFEDGHGKMNLSLPQINGQMLVVSQFTLYGDCRRGRRPSFIDAAPPEKAIPLYDHFIEQVREKGIPVEQGRFGAMMDVHLINDGPVTLILQSKNEVSR
ncbi:MAG: D-tyrosyl-tRNA(Tyr) deacylase [Proteobacteria bacterium]|nr:D-tyrosyl-tRNA(Tyr) deacylase [Pseudomonadota bacterium]